MTIKPITINGFSPSATPSRMFESSQAWTPNGSHGVARTTTGKLALISKDGLVSTRALTDEEANSCIHTAGINDSLMHAWDSYGSQAGMPGSGGGGVRDERAGAR